LNLYSGRVIALGRLLLAMLFMAAIGIDISQPALAPIQTYALLIGYQLFAAVIVVLTWNDWWLDAKLAGPAHAVDIAMFTILVFLTEGYTSPFFLFSIFVLLAAAIRWGWRETTLTAILVAILYLFVGIIAAHSSMDFHFYRFIVRAGQLVIMSLILIWFGIHQWRARMPSAAEAMHAEPRLDRSPLETGLSASMQALGATTGAILWREGESDPVGLVCSEGNVTGTVVEDGQISALPFLYDLKRHRALCRDAQRNLVSCKPASLIGGNLAAAFDLGEGLAIPVRSGTGEGQLFLQGVHLSTDHLDIGEQLGAELAGHIQRHELLEAAAESAAAQSRIALARDLHDSVVQFLAGAAFRLEAMRRSEGAGRKIEPELNELKQLMLQEQGELRAFITALRTGGRVAFTDLSRDLQSLTDRLSRQWAIECDFAAADADVMMSTDVHLDAHQLVREAVANAVRHAGAKSVRVGLSATRDAVRLEMVNDGAAYPKRGRHIDLPKSLRERVELAGGAIDLSRGMGVTKLSISLPVEGRRA
jgi:signal transduction histidine kinase